MRPRRRRIVYGNATVAFIEKLQDGRTNYRIDHWTITGNAHHGVSPDGNRCLMIAVKNVEFGPSENDNAASTRFVGDGIAVFTVRDGATDYTNTLDRLASLEHM